jgi:hypothetical protein
MADKILSFYQNGDIRNLNKFQMDFANSDPIVTFHGLNHTSKNYVNLIGDILTLLKRNTNAPVDIEFACDGDIHKLYLLQCRPQSQSDSPIDISIPDNISKDKILFTANEYVTSGEVKDIKFIVYVNPDEYSKLESYSDLAEIGKIVGELNQILPKKKFILMGPGRWGSRGDIKLGVHVGYSDINNTSVLIEIAKKKQDYVPELSFGTHFFQDLVEAQIKYLPLYPEKGDNLLDESVFEKFNSIKKFLKVSEKFEKVICLLHVEKTFPGSTLTIVMDGDKNKAVGFFQEQ